MYNAIILSMNENKKEKAFTLAEVLITLGIIGVVATLTIPVIMNKIAEQEAVNFLKKDFSDLSAAVNLVKIDNGGVVEGITEAKLTSKLNTLKICNNSSSEGCWHSDTTLPKQLNGNDWGWPAIAAGKGTILANGGFVLLSAFDSSCSSTLGGITNACALITVDVNGAKTPNILGRDAFIFLIIPNKGLIPAGTNGHRAETNPTSYGCREAGGSPDGEGCARRVLTENAINY